MSEKIKDIITRAAKTFWQAALASLAVTLPQIIESVPSGWGVIKPILVSAGIGALAAGFSAAYNGVIKPVVDKHKTAASK